MFRRKISVVVVALGMLASARAAQQTTANSAASGYEEPPGHDLFIPFVPVLTPNEAFRTRQLENVEQIKLLAEMNRLTVELVKRRSNRNLASADTAQLVKRLKDLSKKLRE